MSHLHRPPHKVFVCCMEMPSVRPVEDPPEFRDTKVNVLRCDLKFRCEDHTRTTLHEDEWYTIKLGTDVRSWYACGAPCPTCGKSKTFEEKTAFLPHPLSADDQIAIQRNRA